METAAEIVTRIGLELSEEETGIPAGALPVFPAVVRVGRRRIDRIVALRLGPGSPLFGYPLEEQN